MKQPTSHAFVCQNLRDPDGPKGSSMRGGSDQVRDSGSGVTVLVSDPREAATCHGRMDPDLSALEATP